MLKLGCGLGHSVTIICHRTVYSILCASAEKGMKCSPLPYIGAFAEGGEGGEGEGNGWIVVNINIILTGFS